MITGNKGEWSEFYTFIKLLVDKKIIGADEDLEKIEAIFFPVLKIIREESEGKLEYELQDGEKVKILHGDGETAIVDTSDLKIKVVEIFNEIKYKENLFDLLVRQGIEVFFHRTFSILKTIENDLTHELKVSK